jgi:YD repeat-containing protein
VLSLQHPDGSSESFTYNALGQVLTHTDGKGHTTRLQRNSRGLPTLRRDANGHTLSDCSPSNGTSPLLAEDVARPRKR